MKKILGSFLLLLLCIALLGGCKKPAENSGTADPGNDTPQAETPVDPPAETDLPQLAGPQTGDTIAVFETDKGTFKAVLYEKYAPLAVENFIALAKSDYYKDLLFHRVVDNFVVQTGDPTGTGKGGESASGSAFKNEVCPELHHFTGALGMANAAADLNMSQFYIVCENAVSADTVTAMEGLADDGYPAEVVEAYKKLGGQPSLDYRYTVFGQVYEGLDVIEKIAAVKVDADNRPVKDVKLISVTIDVYTPETKES